MKFKFRCEMLAQKRGVRKKIASHCSIRIPAGETGVIHRSSLPRIFSLRHFIRSPLKRLFEVDRAKIRLGRRQGFSMSEDTGSFRPNDPPHHVIGMGSDICNRTRR